MPEIHTDYIFSGFAEENGFLGVLFLLGLYAALLIIIGIALRKIKDLYAKYLLSGIFIMLTTQINWKYSGRKSVNTINWNTSSNDELWWEYNDSGYVDSRNCL